MNIYNFNGTYTDALIAQIKSNAPKQIDDIKKMYDDFDNSQMLAGARYYANETDILKKQIFTYVDEQKVVDHDATNEKVPSGLHKILVDQKVAYLSGEPMSFGSRSDNKDILVTLEELIGEQWEDTLAELIKNASNKGLEWLHPFVNEEGDFDYMIAEAEQVIPIYDRSKRNQLVAAIRFYSINENHVKLEFWTADDVTYYEVIDNKIYLDVTYEVNPAPHFTNAEGTEWKSWGMVPFIKFANNKEELSDLHFNKRAIDAYESLVSKSQDTIIDIQELINVLKGYEGESLAEFNTNLRRYKAIKVSEEGGIDTLKADIPTQAYQLQAEMLRKNIITSGQGVDPSPEIIGDAPSGVALQNLYALLDMKASMLERKFTLALRMFMKFIEVYCELANRGEFNYRDVTFTFNKMILTNEAEIIQMARDSVGVISDTTILENHPWVSDVGQEQERLAKQKESELSAYDSRYGDLGGEDNGETDS